MPTGPGCPDGPTACLRLFKFLDLDADGRRDRVIGPAERQAAAKLAPDAARHGDGEPPLEGIVFEIVEWRPIPEPPRHHRRTTDADGVLSICFDYPARVSVREIGGSAGGWSLTTTLPDPIELRCATTTDLPVGNARVALPKTGHAVARGPAGGDRYGPAGVLAPGWVGRD